MEPIIGKDLTFESIDGHLLKLIEVNKPEDHLLNAYTYVLVESLVFNGKALLPIFHKLDFKNISEAIECRKNNEDILMFWSNTHYRSPIFNLFKGFLPKLWIRLCNEDSYKIESDNSYKPELQGEARFLATKSLKE